MSKIKNYLFDIEEKIYDAIELGAKSDSEIYVYVQNFININFEDLADIARCLYADYDYMGEANA